MGKPKKPRKPEPPMEPTCYCGHVRDEHTTNEDFELAECTIEDCKCVMYENDPEFGGDDA